MTETLAHRGPDGTGVWQDDAQRVALGHRRLAIVDLSSAGAQPMVVAERGLALVFNGEIYNFRDLRRELEDTWQFKSNTDTEVLLAGYARWGVDVLSRLVGMFAFALWDDNHSKLFIARDRCGEKPLYYHARREGFLFASELKAVLDDSSVARELNWAAAQEFFANGYLAGGQCMLSAVQQLPPGHAAEVDENEVRSWCYWKLPELAAHTGTDDALLEELEWLLADATQRQMVADVPVGILLSGGVDSSLIAALATRGAARRVKSFTISFPEAPHLDEARHAREVAEHLGTEHVELEGRIGGPELLPLLARQFDEPLGDSSQIPTLLVSRLARQQCVVVLGGDGGDELFGGYRHYNRVQRLAGSGVRRNQWVGNAVARCAQHLLPFGVRGRNFLMGFARDAAGEPAASARLFDERSAAKLLGAERRAGGQAVVADTGRAATGGASALWRAQSRDFSNYLPGDILTKVDRASMLVSLEVRAPFLDHRLVEFAFKKVPDALKATATDRKILPKRLARKLLQPTFDVQRKQGFSIPMKQWLQGHWGTFMFDVLEAAPRDLFDRRFVQHLIAGQRAGRSNGEALFALTMFELWRREYRVTY